MNNNDTMRGLFFIVKGQDRKGVEPSYVNKETNDLGYIGGYDPYSKETPNWYMLLDCKTFHCIACGGDFKKVLTLVIPSLNGNVSENQRVIPSK